MKHIFYTFDDLKKSLNEITRQAAKASFNPSIIIGISRGGLIPAQMLSHYYEVPLIPLHISLRDNPLQESDLTALEGIKGERPLVVDDICDGGHTLVKTASILSPYQVYPRFAVLHNNISQMLFQPDFYGEEIVKNENKIWIDYEWETWWKKL